jgi:large subunit ribosomal protein L3
MSTEILGKKLGITQIFDESGNRIPVTVVEAGPNVVIQKKTTAKHKYSAIQIGYQTIVPRKLNKPRRTVFEKLNLAPMKHLREIRMTDAEVEAYKVGDQITVAIFTPGELLDVVGTSKGKGFQGVVKRYHFKGHNMTHGTHEYRRHPGSVGMREKPGKILKGKKMPGHMGNVRVTTQNVKLVKIDPERNLLLIQGSVPGCKGALVLVRKSGKALAKARGKAHKASK